MRAMSSRMDASAWFADIRVMVVVAGRARGSGAASLLGAARGDWVPWLLRATEIDGFAAISVRQDLNSQI
jgi:hypothetical protein